MSGDAGRSQRYHCRSCGLSDEVCATLLYGDGRGCCGNCAHTVPPTENASGTTS